MAEADGESGEGRRGREQERGKEGRRAGGKDRQEEGDRVVQQWAAARTSTCRPSNRKALPDNRKLPAG